MSKLDDNGEVQQAEMSRFLSLLSLFMKSESVLSERNTATNANLVLDVTL